MTDNVLAEKAEQAIARATEPCDYCEHPIVWAVTTNSRMPIDAAPVEGGNVLVHADGTALRASVVGQAGRRASLVREGYRLRQTHKLTCPYADQWSRPGGPQRGRHRTPVAPARRGAGQAARPR